jgi:hypothetical protein
MVGYCLGTKGCRIFKQGKIAISAEVHIVETARPVHPHSSQHAETAGEVIVPGASAAKPHQQQADDSDQQQRQQQPAAPESSGDDIQQHADPARQPPTPADSTATLGEPAGTGNASVNEGADSSTTDSMDGLRRNPQRNNQPTRQLTKTSDIDTVNERADKSTVDEAGGLQRAQRSRLPSQWLGDFYTLTANTATSEAVAAEPTTFEEAMASAQASEWLAAMQEELESLARHDTWELVDSAPAGARPVGTKWVFKIKKDGDGRIQQFKTQACRSRFSGKRRASTSRRSSHRSASTAR